MEQFVITSHHISLVSSVFLESCFKISAVLLCQRTPAWVFLGGGFTRRWRCAECSDRRCQILRWIKAAVTPALVKEDEMHIVTSGSGCCCCCCNSSNRLRHLCYLTRLTLFPLCAYLLRSYYASRIVSLSPRAAGGNLESFCVSACKPHKAEEGVSRTGCRCLVFECLHYAEMRLYIKKIALVLPNKIRPQVA